MLKGNNLVLSVPMIPDFFPSPSLIKAFRNQLLAWNVTDNQRDMPWKGEKNPYKIWLSEIILQQTRVEQGMPYYLNFITRYPTVQDLANAQEDELLKQWEGLGYYNRCRNMHHTAKYISRELGGKFPNQYAQLLKLKGIGPYTAAAIASFAYNEAVPVIDGNVLRVISRFFGIDVPIDKKEGKKYFQKIASALIEQHQPGIYNQAIMDFGATICKPQKPICKSCLLQKNCVAFHYNQIEFLPVKEKKITKRIRYFIYFIIRYKGEVLVEKRMESDIWKGLHQFYLKEVPHKRAMQEHYIRKQLKQWLPTPVKLLNISEPYFQTLTHQKVEAVFVHVTYRQRPVVPEQYFWIDIASIRNKAFPKLLHQFLPTLV